MSQLLRTYGMKSSPVSGALEPVKDVGAAGVINLIKGMGVRLLHCHWVTETTGRERDQTWGLNLCVCVCAEWRPTDTSVCRYYQPILTSCRYLKLPFMFSNKCWYSSFTCHVITSVYLCGVLRHLSQQRKLMLMLLNVTAVASPLNPRCMKWQSGAA